jgi:peptide/nickel transport system substrate-binding protein
MWTRRCGFARALAPAGAFADLDPSSACIVEFQVLMNVYETLTVYTPPGSAAAVRSRLATDWAVADDGLTWTFHLREGATFRDGAPVDAAAVKFSIERNRALSTCAAYIYDALDSIATPDAQTVVFKLRYPAPLDLILASSIAAFILSPAAADKDGAWFNAGNDLGSGPYRIAHYAPGQRLVLEQDPNFRGGWQPDQIDRVVYELVEDPVVAEQMLAAGELDYAPAGLMNDAQVAGLARQDHLRLDVTVSLSNELIFLNHLRSPTNNPLVREALVCSFPYMAVIANTWLGKGAPAHGAVPAPVWGHLPDAPARPCDPAQAKTLLAEAGYPDGLELTFTFDTQQRVTAELWQAALAEIGVTLKLEEVEWMLRWEKARSDPANAPEAYMISWFPDVVGPYSYLYNLFHSQEPPTFNLGFYRNPVFDALIDEGNVLSGADRDAAAEKFIAAQRLLNDEFAAIFIQDLPDPHLVAADLAGLVNNPAYNNTVFWVGVRR